MNRTTLDRQAEIIERWKVQAGVTWRDYVPVNSGVSRTPPKRALLKALAGVAAAQGTELPFGANF